MAIPIPSCSEIMDLVKKGRTLEAQEKIMKLRAACLSLQEDNLNLKEQNLDLRKKVSKLERPLLAAPNSKNHTPSHSSESLRPLREMRDAFEKNYLIHLLGFCKGNMTKAAELAGKHRADLYDLVKKHQLNINDFKKTP